MEMDISRTEIRYKRINGNDFTYAFNELLLFDISAVRVAKGLLCTYVYCLQLFFKTTRTRNGYVRFDFLSK